MPYQTLPLGGRLPWVRELAHSDFEADAASWFQASGPPKDLTCDIAHGLGRDSWQNLERHRP